MKLTVVRYRTKHEMAEENTHLIQAVFQELRAESPDDVRYLCARLSDDMFVHFSIAETKDGTSPIPRLDAFRSFQSGLKERCIESPQQTDHRRQLPVGWRDVRACGQNHEPIRSRRPGSQRSSTCPSANWGRNYMVTAHA
jgi:hypothetical protein